MSSAITAQSGKDMGKPVMGDTMNTTYTGCVEAVNHGGTFLLTHVGETGPNAMHDDMTMKQPAAMMKKDDPTAMDEVKDEVKDTMTPKGMVLVGSSDLKKHVGQKVSVTGSLSNGAMGTMRNRSGHAHRRFVVSPREVVLVVVRC